MARFGSGPGAQARGVLRSFGSVLALGLALIAASNSANAGTTQNFVNGTGITVDTPLGNPTSLYPSPITVSGITGNVITRVQVTLNGLSHTYPDDLDVMLVGPGGERVMLMSDAGGSDDVSGITLTFSATATTPVPQDTALGTATVVPANYPQDEDPANYSDFPGHAPPVLDREPADLGVFNGTNPNGTWSLYVIDDFPGEDDGSIATGWTLSLTVPTVFEVTKTADTNDGNCSVSDCSLREAITAATTATGSDDLIKFSTLFATPQTITLGGSALSINESMTIQGPGADLLTISGNDASSVFELFGTGMITFSGLTVRDGVTAGDGGGIYSEAAFLNLRNVAVAGNRAGVDAGGVFMFGGRHQFLGCTFSDNESSGFGGSAIMLYSVDGAELQLVNTTISGNRAIGNAAVVARADAAGTAILDIVNSTIANNAGAGSGGVWGFTQGDPGALAKVSFRNTILANNGTVNVLASSAGGGGITIDSLGFNLVSENSGGHFDQASDIVNANPRLGPLTNNGGQTESHALMGGSPGLDAGERSGYQRDQRGQLRAFDAPGVATAAGGDASDIGALEMQALMVPFYDDPSLRQAILDANANGTGLDDILFDPDWFSSPRIIQLQSALPAIATSLNIVGPGSRFANVRRNDGGAYRIFEVSYVDGREFSVSGLTISNGNWPAGGGGIFSYVRTSLTEVVVFNNFATSVGAGGAELSRGTIKNSTFALNSGIIMGGALYIGASGFAPGYLRVINSTFYGNVGGDSPGIVLASQFGQPNTLELINSTVTNNSGSSNGGLRVHTSGSGSSTATAILRNSIVAGNTAPNLNATTSGGGASIIDSRGYNLTNDAVATYFDQVTDKINTDPMLGGLVNNGGPTDTQAPLSGSPAIDAGGYSGYLSDQRGQTRPRDLAITNAAGGNGSDIGSVETLPELILKNGFE